MDYYKEIKTELLNNEINRKVKTYSINRSDLRTYYHVGKILSEAGKHYGEGIIKQYSKKLIQEVSPKYNQTNLKRMRQFYQMIQKGAPLGHQLTWSHYKELIPLKDIPKINYYIHQIVERNLSKRELIKMIRSKEYERLPVETKNKLICEKKMGVKDLVPNPILIRNKNDIEIVTEKALQQLILEDIESFMKGIGNSLSFIGSEYKIKIGDQNHYIDLLLFHIKCNCYVVVELKVTEFKAEYISQVQKYMNYIDKNIKELNNSDTMGILICKRENRFVIEYCSDERIAVREYELI